MHTTNRLRQLASTRILHHKTTRTSLQRTAHITRAAKRRHNQRAHRLTRLTQRTRITQRRSRLNTISQQSTGHLHIQQHHVRLQQGDSTQHLVTATDLAHNLQVNLQTQQSGKSLTDKLLVISEQNTNHGSLPGADTGRKILGGTTVRGCLPPPYRGG